MDYHLKVSRKYRQVSLVAHPKLGLVIRSPREISAQQVKTILQKHQQWIDQNIHPRSEILVDGAQITIFGDAETIRFVLEQNTKPHVREQGPELIVSSHTLNHKEVLTKWLKQVAKKGISQRTKELSEQFGFSYKSISIRDQSTRWGSCSGKKSLSFNWRLAFAPLEVLDYVIIHELAHTVQMNHSDKFWQLVSQCMPKYKEHIHWLKQHTQLLHSY